MHELCACKDEPVIIFASCALQRRDANKEAKDAALRMSIACS